MNVGFVPQPRGVAPQRDVVSLHLALTAQQADGAEGRGVCHAGGLRPSHAGGLRPIGPCLLMRHLRHAPSPETGPHLMNLETDSERAAASKEMLNDWFCRKRLV